MSESNANQKYIDSNSQSAHDVDLRLPRISLFVKLRYGVCVVCSLNCHRFHYFPYYTMLNSVKKK